MFSHELSGPKGEAQIEPVNYEHKDLEITRVPDLTPELTCPITYLCLTWKTGSALPTPRGSGAPRLGPGTHLPA